MISLIFIIKQCYYIGGTDDAATRVLGEVSKPMSNFYPIIKICEKLQKKIPGVCELKYGELILYSLKVYDKFRFDVAQNIVSNFKISN